MNCLELRRQFMADPNIQHAELREHLAHCQSCQQFASRTEQLDKVLHEAMLIDIPEGMAGRILLHQRMKTRLKRTRRLFWSVAASLMLAVGTGLAVFSIMQETSLEQSVLAHIHDELKHLDDRKNITLSSLNEITRPQGVELREQPGTVNYAGTCPIRKSSGTHIVLDAPNAPVTVLLMPGEHVSTRRKVHDSRFQGVIVPLKNGSMAIVGEYKDDIDLIERRIMSSISFSS